MGWGALCLLQEKGIKGFLNTWGSLPPNRVIGVGLELNLPIKE
jgi:hypothetical protein